MEQVAESGVMQAESQQPSAPPAAPNKIHLTIQTGRGSQVAPPFRPQTEEAGIVNSTKDNDNQMPHWLLDLQQPSINCKAKTSIFVD